MNETLIHIGLCILAVIVMIVLVVKIINLGFQLIGWIVGKIFLDEGSNEKRLYSLKSIVFFFAVTCHMTSSEK